MAGSSDQLSSGNCFLQARVRVHEKDASPTPHVEQGLLLLKALEVLDPEREPEDIWADCQDTSRRTEEPTRLLKEYPTRVCLGPLRKTPVLHLGQWHYEGKPRKMDLLKEDGPTVHEDTRQGVRDFCKRAAAFGDLSIDEQFIRKQFDIDHQSKPSGEVLHVNLQVPLELKERVGLNKPQEAGFFQKPDHERRSRRLRVIAEGRKPGRALGPYNPQWVKMRYGVWYLSTGLWKKQRSEEPLVDPIVSCKAQDETLEKQLWKQEELLADLHGTVAFKGLVLSRRYRMPGVSKAFFGSPVIEG
ncbi:protein FAM47E [Erethizon dorsatum]